MPRKIDPGLIPPRPNLQFEQALWDQGLIRIAGIDEAGRGCLAGPVAAAAVILPSRAEVQVELDGVLDSKALTPTRRQKLRKAIEEAALCWSVGFAPPEEIDRFGILPATRKAIQRSLAELSDPPDHLLVDYLILTEDLRPQTRLVKGDQRSLSIAAASILAKTHRDQQMISLHQSYPCYDWKNNKGYGTASHRESIREHGPSPHHRMSFAPLNKLSSSEH